MMQWADLAGAAAATISSAQVVTHPSSSSLQEGGRHQHNLHGDQQGGAPARRIVNKREVNGSKHGGHAHSGQGVEG